MHVYGKGNLGVNTAITYYFKTENKNEYKFGNQLSINSSAFYNIPFNSSSLRPFLGASADYFAAIEQFGEELPRTNGRLLSGNVGAEYNFSTYMIGASYNVPIEQKLFDNDVTARNRLSIYINYLF